MNDLLQYCAERYEQIKCEIALIMKRFLKYANMNVIHVFSKYIGYVIIAIIIVVREYYIVMC